MTALGIARRILVVGGLLTAFASAAQAPDPGAIATAKKTFVDRMVRQHQFERADLAALLDQVQINQTIIDTMSKPAERVVPWFEYRRIFLTEERIAAGVQFWREHARELDSVSQRFGVAPEMIVAIVGVETYFGTRMGKYRVLDALATLAFAYPPRASFFASELEQFLLLTREERIDPRSALGSYAGAMGAGQFIPSSYRAYAVDANDDGKRDLWSDWEDALGSVANYFRMHGWKTGDPVVEQATLAPEFKGADTRNSMDLKETVGSLRGQGYVFTTDLPAETPAAPFALEAEGGGSEYWVGFNNFRVITRYNRSPKYALAAFELSQAIRTRYSTAVASNVGSIDR